MKKEMFFTLHCIEKMGYLKYKEKLKCYKSIENLYASLSRPKGELIEIQKKLEYWKEQGINFVFYEEEQYPYLLKQISSPPLGIFYKGRLPEDKQPTLAMIGARNYTTYGREMARGFAKVLSGYGVQIISGMALGIDGFAHEGALTTKTPTFAVLGTGVDICYPKRNIGIYRELEKKGGIISEYEPGTIARPENFPVRNRIISGLSQGVFVIEARNKSGSLITANFALDQNRDVYAVPGRIGDLQSEGCNDLIKQGAKMVLTPEDILENLYFSDVSKEKIEKKSKIVLETIEKMVYAKLRCEPKHIDEIAREADISRVEAIRTLMSLEGKQLSIQITPGYYIRNLV